MIVVQVVFMILMLAIYVICAAWFLTAFPTEVKAPRWIKIGLWCVYGVLCVALPNLWFNDIITMTVLAAYYLVIGWFFYHRSRNVLFYQLIYCVGSYTAQLMGIVTAVQIYSFMVVDTQIYPYILNICKTFFLLIVSFGLWSLAKHRKAQDQKNLKIRGVILVPVCSMVLLFMYVLGAGDIYFIRYGYEWLLVYSALLLAINAYCLYIWYDVAANRELKHRLKLMQQQSELTHQYYEELEKNYSSSRKIIHDIRNHLHILEQSSKMAQIKEDGGQQREDIDNEQYFEDVHKMLNSLGLKFYSENRILNIVLNDKLKEFSAEQVECNMGGVSLDFLSDMDITTIFANLLDNAIEAAQMQENTEIMDRFWLKIRAEQIQDFTVVRIWNFFEGIYQPGYSRKKGHEGLGLKNVMQAIEKYHGELKIEYQQDIFSVTMFFPGQ